MEWSMRFNWKLNGKPVNIKDTDSIMRHFLFEGAKQTIQNEIGALRCPEHNTPPQLVISPVSDTEIDISLTACCEKFHDALKVWFASKQD